MRMSGPVQFANFFIFIFSIKSPQCTDMYSKEKFSIAIFLCDVISGLQAPAKRNDTIVRYL